MLTACGISSPKLSLPHMIRAVQERYRNDPIGFNAHVLKRPAYWWRQEEICRSLLEYRVTVVFSGNATGKDYLLGGIIPWWWFTRTNSLTMVMGVSQTLLGSVTFKEVRRAVEGSALIRALEPRMSQGVKASPQVLEMRPGWHVLGFSTTNVERASGQHSPDLLAIINEGSGVEDHIYDAVDSWVYKRLLVFGNPIRSDGRFVELIRQAEADRRDNVPKHLAVNAIQIPSTDSPHADLDHSPFGLADKTWLEAMYRRYGKDSLWVRSHIKAEVPLVSADTLIPEPWLDWCAADAAQRVRPAGHPVYATRRIACDLGEGVGRDSSCVLVRDDWGVLDVTFGSTLGLPEAAELIWRKAAQWGVPPDRITYDRAGIGRDFPLHLRRHFGAKDTPLIQGYAGAGSPQSKDFANLRSEAAWKLRQRLEPGIDLAARPENPHAAPLKVPFSVPPGPYWPRLREELKTLSYSLAGRKTKLIPKDDHATLLGHSPDIADSLLQSFAFP